MAVVGTIVEEDLEEGEAAVPSVTLDLTEDDPDLTLAMDALYDLNEITGTQGDVHP